MTKRKKYSKEFKLDAIALVVEQNYSQAEASRNLGVNPNMSARGSGNCSLMSMTSLHQSKTKKAASSFPEKK